MKQNHQLVIKKKEVRGRKISILTTDLNYNSLSREAIILTEIKELCLGIEQPT